MVEQIIHDGAVLAIIVRNDYTETGIHFFTPNSFSQQLAYMHHPTGKEIVAHRHNPVPREVEYTQEILFLRKGRLRVDFYDDKEAHLESRILEAGDIILLAKGGHGFKVLDEVEMFEVKQGPYTGEADKTRFLGNVPAHVKEKLR